MTTASVVPDVLTVLYDTLNDAFGTTAQVFDGPPPADFDGDLIAVGYSPLDASGADSTQATATTAGGRDESVDVTVYIAVYGGDADFPGLRARARSYADTTATALKADPTGGVVTGWLEVASTSWIQGPVENGYMVGLSLHIRGTARI